MLRIEVALSGHNVSDGWGFSVEQVYPPQFVCTVGFVVHLGHGVAEQVERPMFAKADIG